MAVQRCPECGNRLNSNYCDICMKRVPFRGLAARKYRDPWDMSSAHREEDGHTCIRFDAQQPKAKPVQTATFPKTEKAPARKKTKAQAIAIVVAVVSLLPALVNFFVGIVEEIAVAEPEYNYEAYVEADVPQITPTELYNDGQIVVTADSAGTYYDDYTIALGIQNNSDRDVSVSTQLLSVNGYMMNYGFGTHISPGESRQDLLQLYSYELEEIGITQVVEIAFCLELYDAETYESIATTELITLKTDAAEDIRQPVNDTGWEMHIDDNLRVVYTGAELSSYGDCDLNLYLENLSNEMVSFTTGGIWINGKEVEGFLWETLRPDTRAVDSIYIYGLEDLDITQFSQITEIYIEYMVDTYQGDEIVDTVYCTTLFNPNALPTSD